MAQNFLNAGLDDLVERTEKETRDDVVYKRVESVNSELRAQLLSIDRSLQAKRTFWGWARDISGNLLVNLVTIFVIGVLAFGYQITGRLQLSAENKVGLGTTPPATDTPKIPPSDSAPPSER